MAVAAHSQRGLFARPTATTGTWSWFTTVDHKKIGILYGTTAFIFFLLVPAAPPWLAAEWGYIDNNHHLQTNVPHIYVAGDLSG